MGIDECNCPGSPADGPKMIVTVTGVNATNRNGTDATGDYVTWLGCNWYNGTPKELCGTWSCLPKGTGIVSTESWAAGNPYGASGLNLIAYLRRDSFITTITTFVQNVVFAFPANTNTGYGKWHRGGTIAGTPNITTYSVINNLPTHTVNNAGFATSPGQITTNQFNGSATTTNGLTITWQKGPNGTQGWGC